MGELPMVKVDKTTTFLLVIDLLVVIWAFNNCDKMSMTTVAVITLITICLLIKSIININNHCLTLTSSLLLYTIATQFGLFIPYFFFGRDVLENYNDYTLRFLDSSYLLKSVILGNIAVLIFDIARRIVWSRCNKERFVTYTEQSDNKQSDSISDNSCDLKLYFMGAFMLAVVILYFAYNILTGGMALFGTYESFMNSSAYNSSIYSYILILFYAGTIYLASSGKIKNHKLGWILWALLVCIFALNGNKGEFLYALLPVFGIKGLEGQKINIKIVLVGALLVFIVIPTITSLRGVGIVNNISNIELNYFDAFTEMGMQIRTSVYSMENLAIGRFDFLLGKSYWKPIVNIINPFSSGTATELIRKLYPGYGYTQVIESYINFGVCGTLAFYFIIGYMLGKFETTYKDKLSLAYYGTITCIFINASRNYFAFVPGQILIVTCIYLLTKYIKVRN